MKAISLWQPWATLIAIGAKKIETRGWGTRYRGPLAIHAAKKWEPLHVRGEAAAYDAFEAAGLPRNLRDVPFGAVVAVCDLADCIETTGGAAMGFLANGVVVRPPEFYYGDYSPGRFAWLLSDVRALPEPVPFRGRQMFFDVPDHLLIL